MNIHSDPVVQSYEPVVVCKLCGDQGHSKLSCTYTKARNLADMSHEDSVFWNYVHPADRPESLGVGANEDELDEDEDIFRDSQEEVQEDSSEEEQEESDESFESDDSNSSDIENLFL